MAKELKEYIDKVDDMIKKRKVNESDIKTHLTKIKFFQHERLVHLIVTMFFALFVIIFIKFTMMCSIFSIVLLILTIFLFFYVIYYYKLENGVQYLYKQYDEMKKIVEKKSLFGIFK